MTLITILGSCRQDSLYKNYNITSIKNNVSYPHYTKEMLQVINFCLKNNIPEEQTKCVFRSAILNNSIIKWSNKLKNEILNTNIFIIEIASRISYLYNNNYVHHILYDKIEYNKYNDNILVRDLTDIEIENDIEDICKILKKPIIIVGHIVTKLSGKRYELLCLLENICIAKNLLFINPVKEITKKGYNILDLVDTNEKHFNHYNDKGHDIIQIIYNDFIKKILNNA